MCHLTHLIAKYIDIEVKLFICFQFQRFDKYLVSLGARAFPQYNRYKLVKRNRNPDYMSVSNIKNRAGDCLVCGIQQVGSAMTRMSMIVND